MEDTAQKIQYFLYARKSSESEDRQIQSIDDQVNRLKNLADNLHLHIKQVYTESKSAKKPQNRPVFDEMMARIEKGEADGILCWQINRLSRNPIDSGTISWHLQRGVIKSIRTIDREYLPQDNVLLLSVESGVANQYILDLSKNVKRGIQSRLEKGWIPNVAPLGYLNDKDNKTIIKDSERFNLIRKMWDLMLTGHYTPPRILEIANKEWAFRTRKFKRIGGNELSKSGIYKIFTNLAYAGIIEHLGQQFPGKHDPMITLEEYDRVQMILGRNGKPRPQTHSFAYTGCIRCGVCGCLYTAETKKKLIKETGEVKEYTYYHCTRKTRKVACNQKKNVRVDKLELMIGNELGKYTILPQFLDWAVEELSQINAIEVEDQAKIFSSQQETLKAAQKELEELIKMRYKELIDDESFIREKSSLQVKIDGIKAILEKADASPKQYLELTKRSFRFITYAQDAFLTGGLELKKEILLTLGNTPIIKDEMLHIEPEKWLVPIQIDYPELEAEYLMLEPTKTLMIRERTEAIASIRTRWRGIVNDVRTIIEKSEGKFKIIDIEPDFLITLQAA